jgi:hypothetical protein
MSQIQYEERLDYIWEHVHNSNHTHARTDTYWDEKNNKILFIIISQELEEQK